MPALTEILDHPSHNGVYWLRLADASHRSGTRPDVLITEETRLNAVIAERPDILRLDARDCPDKDRLLQALGEALRFPDYYGRNWDALEECLFDLSWWSGPVIVLIAHAHALERETLATLVDIWTEASAAWAQAGRVCVLLLANGHQADTPPANSEGA